MNSQQMINSIYNPRKKPREPFVFPKINKAEASPSENKVFVRGASRKYNQHNIFKIEDEKKQRVKMHIEEERLRELRQRECDEIQLKMAAMNRRHLEQMREIEEQQKNIAAQIDAYKKNQYQVKYTLWELKNQIMNLNALYLEQENQYQRLYQEFGYVDEEGEEMEGEEGEEVMEGEEEENYEGEEGEEYQQEQFLSNEEGNETSSLNRASTVQMQEEPESSQHRLYQNPHNM